MFTFLILFGACLTSVVGGVFLIIYLFVDHDNKQYKKNGIILLLTGWGAGVLAFLIDYLLI